MEQAVFAAVGYSCPPWEDMILFSMDESGALRRLDGACLGCSPSFLCEDGQGGLFVGCENPADAAILHFPGSPAGSVREWRLPYRQLCHLMRHGNTLYASCYGDGVFFALDAASGREVWHACMQPGRSRAHWSAVSPDGAALFACDLGADSVYCFRLLHGRPQARPMGRLRLPDKSGPRQVLAKGRRLYVLGQDDSTISVFESVQAGLAGAPPRRVAASCARVEARNYPSVMAFTRDGQLLAANRGADTLACFAPTADGGLAMRWERPLDGSWPRFFCLSADGRFALAAMRHTGQVQSYRLDAGGPRLCGALPLPEASCILPLGRAGGAVYQSVRRGLCLYVAQKESIMDKTGLQDKIRTGGAFAYGCEAERDRAGGGRLAGHAFQSDQQQAGRQ